jgi:proteasome assembly chaperone (PAC2) family protein
MPHEELSMYEKPELKNARLLLGFSGWMDGGDVSTGPVKELIKRLGAKKFASIKPEGFYIYSFPGSMEMTALFRPHTKIEDGLVKSLEMPSSEFYYDAANNVILFLGKEPNLRWNEFTECIFSLCSQCNVESIYFIGSVAGLVPHTREPRILCSLSEASLKEQFERYGVKFTNYEGPASIVTTMTSRASAHGFKMASLVAMVPAYVHGENPKCIEAVTRRLAGILGLQVNLDDLRQASDEFEKKLSEVVGQQEELAGNISKLEEDYDNEIFDSEMGELKDWLQQKGIRLD